MYKPTLLLAQRRRKETQMVIYPSILQSVWLHPDATTRWWLHSRAGQGDWQQHHLRFLALLLSSLCRACSNSSSVGSELLALGSHLDMMDERMELNWFLRSILRCEMARTRSFSSVFLFFLTRQFKTTMSWEQMVATCKQQIRARVQMTGVFC